MGQTTATLVLSGVSNYGYMDGFFFKKKPPGTSSKPYNITEPSMKGSQEPSCSANSSEYGAIIAPSLHQVAPDIVLLTGDLSSPLAETLLSSTVALFHATSCQQCPSCRRERCRHHPPTAFHVTTTTCEAVYTLMKKQSIQQNHISTNIADYHLIHRNTDRLSQRLDFWV